MLWMNGLPLNLGAPDGFGEVRAFGDGRQGGTRNSHATLWMGTPQSGTDLHPALVGATASRLIAIGGGVQGGSVTVNDHDRAAIWAGSALSYTDITPVGALGGQVNACIPGRQGGTATFGDVFHAGLWQGSSSSFVDLNPPGDWGSTLAGMTESEQVGLSSMFGMPSHATIWHGSWQSRIDLHPGGGASGVSGLLATSGQAQVGFSSVPGFSSLHAGIWFGTAESFVDLHALLGPEFLSSQANSIYQDAQQIIVGGSALRSNAEVAVVWTLNIPAPGSVLGVLGLTVLAAKRRRG
jgi:hypothetical protein